MTELKYQYDVKREGNIHTQTRIKNIGRMKICCNIRIKRI